MTQWYGVSTGNINSANLVGENYVSMIWNDAANGLGNYMTWPAASTFQDSLPYADKLKVNTSRFINVTVPFTCSELSVAGTGYFNITSSITIGTEALPIPVITTTGTSAIYSTIYLNGNNLTVVIWGNILGYAGSSAGNVRVILDKATNTGLNLTVNGNVTGGSPTTATGAIGISITQTTASVLTINGNVLGGSSNSMYNSGIQLAGNVTAIISGTVTGGSGAYAQGQWGLWINTSIGTVTITNDIIAGTAASAIQSSNATAIISVTGSIVNGLTTPAFQSGSLRWQPAAGKYMQMIDSAGNSFKCAAQLPAAQVLKGITHGDVIGTLSAESPFRRVPEFV